MANEIQYRHDQTGENLYAVIVNAQPGSSDYGKYWNTAGTPAWEALNVANWAEYDVGLSESPSGGYRYQGDFPAGIGAGVTAAIMVFRRLGANPAIADPLVAAATAYWDGSALHDGPTAALAGDVDSTGEGLALAKAVEAILAVVAGNSSFNEGTGACAFKGRDGSTTIVTNVVAGVGTRTDSEIP